MWINEKYKAFYKFTSTNQIIRGWTETEKMIILKPEDFMPNWSFIK